MIKLKILGPGCRSCEMLEQMAAAGLMDVLDENPDLEATIVHIDDLDAILQYPVLVTPALVINEKVVSAGRVPHKQEIVNWIHEALNHNE